MALDFDAPWDAWLDAGHGDHGGFLHDRGRDVIRCACGTVIPCSPVPAVPAAAGTEHMPDPAPGYEWYRELTEDTA